MSTFFESYFDIQYSDKKNVSVCCPFEHATENGILYKESNPSAHINLDKGLFHCKVCDKGFNELTFIMATLKCSIINATKLKQVFQTDETAAMWDEENTEQEQAIEFAKQFNISSDVIKELHISSCDRGEAIRFPVFMYNHLMDVRKYHPQSTPKVKSREDAPTGLVIPFDIWRTTPKKKITMICAGEKDMAVARSMGFNAITLTGGELSLPISPNEFIGRKVVIVYDNDEAGHNGANKLANYLQPYVESIKICTGFHEVCKENKEDITDFFNKYGKKKEDLIKYLNEAPFFTPNMTHNTSYPVVDLRTASDQKHVNKIMRSNIQVVAMYEATFLAPSAIVGEKVSYTDDKHTTMRAGEVRAWELNEDSIQGLLHLIDNNFKEEEVLVNCRKLMRIPEKERCVCIKRYDKIPVFKCAVTDLFETGTGSVIPMEYTAYSINHKLESGKKYMATYKLVPHPYHGQQLVMLITNVFDANDTVTNFKIDSATKAKLAQFQKEFKGHTIAEQVDILVEKAKGLLGFNCDSTLIKALDLSYHTVLGFNFGNFKNVRGYLDTFVVGESRVGKSSTANALRDTYKLGIFTSLAGASATIPGLIGGSNKQNGSFQTRAGLIPQNHKGLIIFEEFGKSNHNIITELTDIRSSNEVRITRVSGTLTLPASVRMITLTNTKTSEGTIKPISSYPNGISVITELIGTAEDIARYDLLVVLGTHGAKHIDPLWEPETPFAEELYQAKVRWVWSRTLEQVVFTEGVEHYIVKQANELNDVYDSHIKIFGTEAWKKISRLAIAVAGYTVSTDESYENILVTAAHVDYAVTLFKELYDNPTFKLKEYVANERRFSEIDSDGVAALQEIYMKSPSMVLHLEQVANTTKNAAQAATGLTNDEYNSIMNMLIRSSFIRFTKYEILPTERFRKGLGMINRKISTVRLGDNSVAI